MVKQMIKYILFFSVFGIVYGAMNFYLYWSINEVFAFHPFALVILKVLFWLLGSAFLFSQMIKRRYRLPIVAYIGAAWMGVLSISLTIFFIKDLLLFFLPLNRQLAGQWAFWISTTLIGLSILNVYRGAEIKRVHITHKKHRGKKTSIVLLSDVHLGLLTSEKWLKEIVNRVNGLKADAVVITGDLVDDSYDVVERFAPIMKAMKSKYGTYAVAGNHEHYQGIDHFVRFLETADITLLNDEVQSLTEGINLIGIDDLGVSRVRGIEKRLKTLVKDCKPEQFNILLIHQPVGFRKAAKMGIDMQLSGHTHRGQVPPLNLLVYFFYPYAYGLRRYGDSYIYTTSGTGTWGPPMRLFSRCEIVAIEIN